MSEIKSIEWNDVVKNGITGISGKVYRLESKLNTDRYAMMQEYIIELEYGIGLKATYGELNKIAADMNAAKIMDASIKLHKLQTSFYQVITRADVAARIAALFLNAEDEDRTSINDAIIQSKLTDWRQYEYAGFFTLCSSIINGFRENFSEAIQSGLIKA